MEITKKGTPPWIGKIWLCDKCDTEFKTTELDEAQFFRRPIYLTTETLVMTQCPTCKTSLFWADWDNGRTHTAIDAAHEQELHKRCFVPFVKGKK